MTYYETAAGARVFAAGTLDFGGSVAFWPVTRMLENLWQHMLADLPAPAPLRAAPVTPSSGRRRPRLEEPGAVLCTMTPSSSILEPAGAGP